MYTAPPFARQTTIKRDPMGDAVRRTRFDAFAPLSAPPPSAEAATAGRRREVDMTGGALVVLLVAQSFHVSLNGKPRMVVIDALHEAYELLDRPACVGVFDEFRDRTGSRVSQTLLAAGQTPREWLLGLYFVEGDSARCKADPSMAAYTLPDSRVVWICGDRFAERFAMAVRPASYLVIHEVLHTTGLGENPPSSAQITAAVARSCGR